MAPKCSATPPPRANDRKSSNAGTQIAEFNLEFHARVLDPQLESPVQYLTTDTDPSVSLLALTLLKNYSDTLILSCNIMLLLCFLEFQLLK